MSGKAILSKPNFSGHGNIIANVEMSDLTVRACWTRWSAGSPQAMVPMG